MPVLTDTLIFLRNLVTSPFGQELITRLPSSIASRLPIDNITLKFRKLFGCRAENSGLIRILLPVYPVNGIAQSQQERADPQKLKENALKALVLTDTSAAVLNDVRAANCLATAFYQRDIPTTMIEGDEDYVAILAPQNHISEQANRTTEQNREVYVLVGLSNKILENYNKEVSSKRYFFIVQEDDNKNPIIKINKIYYAYFFNGKVMQQNDWEPHVVKYNSKTKECCDGYDYGLFAKMVLPKITLIVCGGTTELGTKKLGEYVKNEWEHIYDQLSLEKQNKPIDINDSFAVTFRIPVRVSTDEGITIQRKCVEP